MIIHVGYNNRLDTAQSLSLSPRRLVRLPWVEIVSQKRNQALDCRDTWQFSSIGAEKGRRNGRLPLASDRGTVRRGGSLDNVIPGSSSWHWHQGSGASEPTGHNQIGSLHRFTHESLYIIETQSEKHGSLISKHNVRDPLGLWGSVCRQILLGLCCGSTHQNTGPETTTLIRSRASGIPLAKYFSFAIL